MHGFSSGSSLLVNPEVDSMGGIVDSGVGITTETSPCQVVIQKVLTDLRLEYDVREERRRELEFLAKGGNPLDFKFGVVAPLSVQSSSLADQVHDQLRTCEAKGSFSLAASPHGDSIGSSGRQRATLACEPNSADNFDGENELVESEGKSTYVTRSNIIPSEHSSQVDGTQNIRESEDSPNFHPKKAYRRRNRSKTNRDSARSSSTGIGLRGDHNSSLSDCHRVVSKSVHQESPSDKKMNVLNAGPSNGRLAEVKLDLSSSKHMHGDPHKQNIKDIGASTAMASVEPDPSIERQQTTSAVNEFHSCSGAENSGSPKKIREPDQLEGGEKCSQTEGIVSRVAVALKRLDSESSCTQTNFSIDRNGNIDSGLCTSLKNVDIIGEQIEEKLPLEPTAKISDEKILSDRKVADAAEGDSCTNDSHFSQNHKASSFPEKDEGGINKNQLSAQFEAHCGSSAKETQSNQHTNAVLCVKQGSLDDNIPRVEGCCSEKPQQPRNPSVDEITKTDISCSVSNTELQLCDENQTKVADKEYEERILEEAQNIKARCKIMEKFSFGSLPMDYRHKCHWDFVLEEMAWMSNDFAQERVWKRTAATQLCYRAAFASRLRLEAQNKYGRVKAVAQTLAKAVADFWHSAALLAGKNGNCSGFGTCEHGTSTSENTNDNSKVGNGGLDEESSAKNIKIAVQGYAVRFLQHNSSIVPIVKDSFSATPERVSTIGTLELTYQNQHAEENLFYAVPHRAMEAYGKAIERYLVQCERARKNMQEANALMYEAVAEFDSQDNQYEEYEGENLYYLPGAFEESKASKFAQKKYKSPKLYSPRVYEVGSDLYGPCTENKASVPQYAIKRIANGLNGSPIPTKRVRTASRQRVVGPFRSGAAGFMPVSSRTDASSGDTNSSQDDQSTQCGGSLIPKGLEVQSGMDYDKQAAFDSVETAVKPKKKKKAKHQATPYEPRWQVDCNMQIEQKDNFSKRSEHPHVDFNGPFGHHAKKPKVVKHSLDSSIENTTLMSESVASPMGSQMSNMSNTNKLIKLIGGRDRGRKTKSLKISSGQSGSVSKWSLFEDQALVVLVHDMGPNWELVSDAFNSTLHFKCIFRKPKECKERHRNLLERRCGDGADTEDSISSQHYPSTLPGIPKGGARQLFQQLRGPMEEDTIRSHFEKIILIGQQLHCRKKDAKQLVCAHNSHLAALSQVIPNNLHGGVLTPLDLCDMAVSSPDVFSLSHQGPHTGGLPFTNQESVQSMLPLSTNSSFHGSAPAQLNAPARDARYGSPRTNLPTDEQQRGQYYNQVVSGRNIQQPNMPVPGTIPTNDRGGNILPGGNGNGMVMSGMNRSMSMPRPGLQGVSSSSVPSSGSMVASNTVGMASSMNMHSGATAGQGNTLLRSHDGVRMARPGQNPEQNRQMMSSEMEMQGFPNQSASPSGPVYPVHQQQHQTPRQNSNVPSNSHHQHLQGSAHLGSAEQQAFAVRLARDRQLQQRIFQRQQQKNQQQHQQFPASGGLMSPVPTQSHLPVSTALQNSSQIKSQAGSQSVSVSSQMIPSSPIIPVTYQQQQKHQLPHHGLVQTAQSGVSAMINEGGKQRQPQAQQLQQQLVQPGRHHPPQRQPSQSQQANRLKGMGRGNMSVLQNHPIDSSHLDGRSDSPGSQLEKGEQPMCPTQSSKPVVPPPSAQSHPQQKLCSKSAPASSKQVQQMHSHPDCSNLSQAAAVTSTSVVPILNQGVPLPIVPSPNHQQLKVEASFKAGK